MAGAVKTTRRDGLGASAPRVSPLAAAIERRLEARSQLEKAFFDGSPASYPLLVLVIAVWGFELMANFQNGEGWASLVHWAVIVPLELLVIVALAAGLRTLVWRARLALLRRGLAKRQAASRQPRERRVW